VATKCDPSERERNRERMASQWLAGKTPPIQCQHCGGGFQTQEEYNAHIPKEPERGD